MSDTSFYNRVNLVLEDPKAYTKKFLKLFTPREQGPALLAIIEAARDTKTSSKAMEAIDLLMKKQTASTVQRLAAKNFDAIYYNYSEDYRTKNASVVGTKLLTHAMPVLDKAQKALVLDQLFAKTFSHDESIKEIGIDSLIKISKDKELSADYQEAISRNFEAIENLLDNYGKKPVLLGAAMRINNIQNFDSYNQEDAMSMLWARMHVETDKDVQKGAAALMESLYQNEETRPFYLAQMQKDFKNSFEIASRDFYSPIARGVAMRALERTAHLMSDEQKAQTLKMSQNIISDKYERSNMVNEARKLKKTLSPQKPSILKAALAVITLGALSLFVKPAKADPMPSQPRAVPLPSRNPLINNPSTEYSIVQKQNSGAPSLSAQGHLKASQRALVKATLKSLGEGK